MGRTGRRLLGAVGWIAWLCGSSVGAARADTAGELVHRMETAYAGLKSYSQQATAVGLAVIEGSGRRGIITSEVRFQRPDQLYLSVTNSQVGTVSAATDGKLQTIYFGKRNAYLQAPTPAGAQQFVEGLKRFQIVAVLDPLYFLAGNSASKLAANFTLKSPESVNGVPCFRVVGDTKKNAVQTARAGTIAFWIDRKTFLLRKMHLELKGVPIRTSSRPANAPKAKPSVTVSLADETLTETVTQLQLNPALKPADFTLVIPPTAKKVGAPSR